MNAPKNLPDKLQKLRLALEKEMIMTRQFPKYIGAALHQRQFAALVSIGMLLRMMKDLLRPDTGLVQEMLGELYRHADKYDTEVTELKQSSEDTKYLLRAVEDHLFGSCPVHDQLYTPLKSDQMSVQPLIVRLTDQPVTVPSITLYDVGNTSYLLGAPFANGTDWWLHPWEAHQAPDPALGLTACRLSELIPLQWEDFQLKGRIPGHW